MTIHFYLKYHTQFGQSLYILGNHEALGNNEENKAVALSYLNEDFWKITLEFDEYPKEPIFYKYILKDADGTEIFDGDLNRYFKSPVLKKEEIAIYDTWNATGEIKNVFNTAPFLHALSPNNKIAKIALPRVYNYEFRVKAPILQNNEMVCLTGSSAHFGTWDTDNPILLSERDGWYIARIHLNENEWPVTYKYGIYNVEKKQLVELEKGDNRILPKREHPIKLIILTDEFLNSEGKLWRGAGVSIPVFSLRSQKSFGVGEFNDIKLLIDWAHQTGLQLIQLLPINDTTAHHNWSDSYPYAAISAFALHPLYINLEKVAGKEFSSIVKPLRKKQKQLNDLAEFDYEQVMKFKISALKELYDAQKENLKNDKNFTDFIKTNSDWLIPYAAFCFLRDKYETPDFLLWKKHSNYDASAIKKLVAISNAHYHKIAFFYFVQYHLHLQMKEVCDYAHKKSVVLKGDIPIGIYRYGCDAWVNPSLYNMDEQAGAPPDDFAVKGQNWGFPTYNWSKMKEDNFEWWRKRFNQMSSYFDAFRIDHILGFFRIWSIPMDAVEGILGRFVPAIPIDIAEFHSKNIWFDYHRYCSPFINEDLLWKIFGDRVEEIKNEFLEYQDGRLALKEFVNTQQKVVHHLGENPDEKVKQGLFDLISNVILIEEKNSNGQNFHFRISMDKTYSFSQLENNTQQQLKDLYVNYFYRRQDDFWKKEALKKLPALKRSTNMLVCGEDLGMVPHCVPEVMGQLGILSLEIERMPKDSSKEFFHPNDAPYLSVVTPSTHDMSTIRGWWEEDREKTQKFYNFMLGHYGQAPFFCEGWINKEIVLQHLYSPAMLSIFQLQDLLGMNESIRLENPNDERINIPSDPNHYWHYRMHIPLESLIQQTEFNHEINRYIIESGRGAE